MATKLEQIEAREQAATPGPWDDMGSDDAQGLNGMYAGSIVSIEYDDSPMMMPTKVTVICREAEGEDRQEDRAFIAHSRADIPLLLAGIRAAVALFTEIEETAGCSCGPEYTGRGLVSPTCALHSWGLDKILADWKAAIAPLMEKVG